jgi:hypothetical protein
MLQAMVIHMNDGRLQTLAQLQAFLDGTAAVDFAVTAEERYRFIRRTVRCFGYRGLKRAQKAVVLRFLERVSGYSRQQLTRLVKRGAERAPLLKRYRGSRTSFASRYTLADVLLLAHTDSLHGTLSGPRLERRLRQIERLSPKPKQQFLSIIDTFIAAEQNRQGPR